MHKNGEPPSIYNMKKHRVYAALVCQQWPGPMCPRARTRACAKRPRASPPRWIYAPFLDSVCSSWARLFMEAGFSLAKSSLDVSLSAKATFWYRRLKTSM